MTINKINIKQITFAAAAALLLAGCASEELADGDRLPEGAYPLEIALVNVTGEVQTRVAESSDGSESIWDGKELIAVKFDGTSEIGHYIINADGSTNVGTQIFWSKTTDNITAWYPVISTIDLANQSTKLVYAMKASKISASYNNPVNLEFKHQLAKIRVLLTGTADMQGGTVQVKGYTMGTINNGLLTGYDDGWITMKKCSYSDGNICYEANVIPGVTLSDAAFQVTAQNGTATPLTLDAPLSVSDSGKIYEITLTVNNKGTKEIDLTSSSDTGNPYLYTVAANASVVLDGKSTLLNNKHVIINDGARVVLKNVKLTAPKTDTHVIEVKGSATITLSGENEIIGDATDTSCPIAITQANATLTINGTIKDKLTLTSKGTYAVGLGAANQANLIINGGTIIANGGNGGAAIGGSGRLECGNITINGGVITANGGENSAAIGAGVWEQGVAECVGKCGNITINGGKIIAQGNDSGSSSSGIGAGLMSTCGLINITGGNITATAGTGAWGAAGIGCSVYGTCGNITITGGTINATGKKGTTTNDSGSGIGAASEGTCGKINISGTDTSVTATGGDGSDDIGWGYSPDSDERSKSGTVTIASEANVIATNGKIHGN